MAEKDRDAYIKAMEENRRSPMRGGRIKWQPALLNYEYAPSS